jgi:hypothetical protein
MGNSILKKTISSGVFSWLFTGLWVIFGVVSQPMIPPYLVLTISLIIGGSLILATCCIWNNTQAISGLFIFLLGFIALIVDLIQFQPLSTAPTTDFILMGGLMLSGLATLFTGKASPIIGGFLLLATWFVWDYMFVQVCVGWGGGDIWYRVSLPILAALFIFAGAIVAVANRKKRKRK